jgi:hypothetical protein
MPAATPELQLIADKLLNSIRACAAELIASTDADGKIAFGGKWTTYNQGAALVFAEIYKDEGGGHCGSAEVLTKLEKSVEYFLSLLDEKGEVPFSTALWSGGGMVPSWEFEAFVGLLRWHGDILSKRFTDTLRDGLARIAAAHVRELPEERLHNIPGFAAAALWKAGDLFGEEEWKRVAREYLAKLADSQFPDGYWREHTGPTTSYNLVYTSAMGTHLADGGEVDVRDALRRAGAFHSRFSYPDGSLVSVIDGRVLYGGGIRTTGLVGLVQAHSAAGYVSKVAGSAKGFGRPMSNASVFVPQSYRLIVNGLGPVVEGEPDVVPLGEVASVIESGNFTAVSSALTGACELHQNCHWGYERLQHLEVHHRRSGVVIGGGQSQGPEMAFLNSGGVHLADSAAQEEGGRRLRLEYPWGEAVIGISARGGGLEVAIDVSARGPVRMLLPVLRGWIAADGREPEAGKVDALEAGGVCLRAEPRAELVYPLKPWYTYSPEGRSPEGMWRYGLGWESEGDLHVKLQLLDGG